MVWQTKQWQSTNYRMIDTAVAWFPCNSSKWPSTAQLWINHGVCKWIYKKIKRMRQTQHNNKPTPFCSFEWWQLSVNSERITSTDRLRVRTTCCFIEQEGWGFIVDCLSNGELLLLPIVHLNKKEKQYKRTQQLTIFLVLWHLMMSSCRGRKATKEWERNNKPHKQHNNSPFSFPNAFGFVNEPIFISGSFRFGKWKDQAVGMEQKSEKRNNKPHKRCNNSPFSFPNAFGFWNDRNNLHTMVAISETESFRKWKYS